MSRYSRCRSKSITKKLRSANFVLNLAQSAVNRFHLSAHMDKEQHVLSSAVRQRKNKNEKLQLRKRAEMQTGVNNDQECYLQFGFVPICSSKMLITSQK